MSEVLKIDHRPLHQFPPVILVNGLCFYGLQLSELFLRAEKIEDTTSVVTPSSKAEISEETE